MSKNSTRALYEQAKIFNNYIQYSSKKRRKVKSKNTPEYFKSNGS